ncbi:MAG: LysM peptidoglycan-binding domain-containing protein [Anaerolineae bacterium]|nr:LysM peptidoglycan-binding domain-containing protein [Anaerolineae bacterium]
MRRSLLIAIALITIHMLYSPGARESFAQDPASEVLSLVNAARAEVGAPPLTVHSALQAAAQEFTEWRTQNGVISHTGPGGSTPTSRARAAGYDRTYIGENIVEGHLMTPDAAVRWWRGSPVHYRNLISENYQHVGIGYTITADGYKRYTLLMGGGGVQRPAASSSGSRPEPEEEAEEPPQVIIPVEIAAPRPEDGAVIHAVQQGQALWTIAAVYQVDLARLLELNNLYEGAYIRPGDEIIIDPGSMTPEPKAPLVHVVQAGQTLWELAAYYRVDLNELMQINGIEEGHILHAGDEIVIRPGAPTPAPIPTGTPPPTDVTTSSPAPTETAGATAAAVVPTSNPITPSPTAAGSGDDETRSTVSQVALALGVALLGFGGIVALVGFTLERRQGRR